MKVTFPHMGVSWVGIRHLLTEIGFDVVVPPTVTKRTLELGTKYSPEFICLPFKVNLGNYLEAIEAGAEIVFMVGGIGPCRLGYYAEVQREIMHDLKLQVEVIVLERDNFVAEIARAVKSVGISLPWNKLVSLARFCLAKVCFLDDLEASVLKERYREKTKGSCSQLFEQAVQDVNSAGDWHQLRHLKQHYRQELPLLLHMDPGQPLRVGLVGEIYMLIESTVNLQIAEKLGEMGASVERNMYSSHWVREHLIPDWRMIRHARHIERLAKPYLPYRVGGHGLETIGSSVDYARRRFDGVVQVLPLTCMPEIIAESILPTLSRHHNLPVMTVTLDEHSGEAGLVTRLEAFLDMLYERRREKGETRSENRVGD